MERLPMMIKGNNSTKMSVLPKASNRIKVIPVKIPTTFCTKCEAECIS